MVMGWDGIWSNITMSCMGWAGLRFDGMCGVEWGVRDEMGEGIGLGVGTAGEMWRGVRGMGLMGWGGGGGTEDGDAGWGCWCWGLHRMGWGGREIGLSPADRIWDGMGGAGDGG